MDRRISREVNVAWDEVLEFEQRILEEACEKADLKCGRLVDVGCGSRGLLGRRGSRVAGLQSQSWGIDLDHGALRTNSNVAHRVCANCYSLPFRSETVDIIVCRWVVEHLESPERAMREFARVLKKGGLLYVKTPNLWNYTMLVSRVTPVAFHNVLRSANGHADNTPTFYRANTRRRLMALAGDAGLNVERLELYSYSYMYYSFNKEIFLVMRGLSRLFGKLSTGMCQTLVGVFEKK